MKRNLFLMMALLTLLVAVNSASAEIKDVEICQTAESFECQQLEGAGPHIVENREYLISNLTPYEANYNISLSDGALIVSGTLSGINDDDYILWLEFDESTKLSLDLKSSRDNTPYTMYIQSTDDPIPTVDDPSEEETPAVTIYPEDEFGAYYLTESGSKEYVRYHDHDICMKFMGIESSCDQYFE